MPKVSQLPLDSAPATPDYLVGNQASGPTTQRFKFSDILTFIWTLANIPSGATSPVTRDSEMSYNFVPTGLAITGDSVGVNRNATMSAGVCYVNGRRISLAAVSARTYTASKDTYVDVLDNGDGTGTLVYTEVTNGAASPSLAANSIRIGKVVTGATTIAATSSITQIGQDSLGNNIYWRLAGVCAIGMTTVATAESTTSTTYADLTTTDSVTLRVGNSGIAEIGNHCELANNTANAWTFQAIALSGANTVAAADNTSIKYQAYGGNASNTMGDMITLTGLTPGLTTFNLQHKVQTGGGGSGTGTFTNRRLSVRCP